MAWEPGSHVIDDLLDRGELQRVVADLGSARALIDSARRHLDSADTIAGSDPEGAFAALYDAARKACAALLEAQGLRATSRGGHVAIREAVVAQFGGLPHGNVVRRFDRLRRRRHEIEYPSGPSFVEEDEVREGLERSTELANFAEALFEELPVF